MIILILGGADKQNQKPKQSKNWILPFYFCLAKVYEET